MSISNNTTKVKTRYKLTGTLEERRKEVENRIHDWYPNLEILVIQCRKPPHFNVGI